MAIGTPVYSTQQFRLAEASTAVNMPATVNSGDFLFIWGRVNNATLVTLPAGWTSVVSFSRTSGTNPPSLFFAYKTGFAAGTEGGTTVSVTHPNNISTWIAGSVSGVDTTTPIDATPITGDTGASNTSSSLTGYTTTVAGCFGIWIASQSGTSATSTPPAGWTEVADNTAGSNVGTLCTLAGLASGSQGTVANTWSATLQHIEAMFALRPAPSGTTWSADGSLAVTATGTGTIAVTHTVDGSLAVTETGTATAAATHTVDGSLAVTETGTATAAATHTVDGSLAVTATRTATAAATHTIDGSLAVTETGTATASTAVINGTLAVTATGAATAAVTHTVDGSLSVTASRTATAAATHTIDGSLAVTATQAGTSAATHTIDATLAVTVTRSADMVDARGSAPGFMELITTAGATIQILDASGAQILPIITHGQTTVLVTPTFEPPVESGGGGSSSAIPASGLYPASTLYPGS